MIDETLLIEKIKERIEIHKKDYQAFKNYSGDRKIKDIAKWDECTVIIDFIKNQSKVGEWIPCSERLPDRYCHCLVTRRNEYEDGYDTDVREDVYLELEGVWDWHSKFEGLHDEIVAWQPLPPAYKE